MSLPLLIQGLGSVGVFAARAFLPAFVTALLLRFGPRVPWLADVGLLRQVRDVPAWFTSDTALVALGVLSALELVAERVPEAQALLDAVHGYLKAGMAALTYLGVLGVLDRAALAPMIRQAGLAEAAPALLVGAGTLLASRVRGAVVAPLVESDEDDDLGLQGLLRWVGDLWGSLGPVALVVLPMLTLAAFGLAVILLFLVERRVESRRDRAQVPCGACGRPIPASALVCRSCRAPVKAPRDVGLLGQPRARPADLATHPYRLVAVKRCPVCATRLRRRAVRQTCGACGHRLMDDPDFARRYVRFIDRRVPLACGVGFLLGLIPVLGVIPGVIAYRLTIVAPFRRYIPPGRGFVLRWGLRLVTLALVAIQWVPVAGGLAVPALALIHYGAYRGAYRKLAPSP